MLVLTRKVGESLVIADGEVRVVVLSVRGSKVRLGIAADRDIGVVRSELLEKGEENGE